MKRRDFVGALAAASFAGPRWAEAETSAMQMPGGGSITDVEGIRVGHYTDTRRPTGCTVILYERGAVAGVDVRGSAPGTRETDLLRPTNLVDTVNAVVLTGGSAFGLDAASGVMRYLDEHGFGFPTAGGKVPIVPAAVLFDLTVGDGKIRPTAESGYQACVNAKAGAVAEGNVGAGAGATVGKLLGNHPMKSGIGTSSIRLANGLVVAAIVAVNGVGDVYDHRTGEIVAGARTPDGKSFLNQVAQLRKGVGVGPAGLGQNTTIGVIATNAKFDKTQMTKIAQMGHDGMARAIDPSHTSYDGDTLFAMSTGTATVNASLVGIGSLAAEVVSDAMVRAVMSATSIPGYPSYRDIPR
ncbi:MAG TPA: P1 family peptidase [Gemmatimonadaceae bacterium]|nr:P1 family peptidase [Gemmatimonadaceae bacterium]